MTSKAQISRRKILALTTAATSVATLAVPHLSFGSSSPKPDFTVLRAAKGLARLNGPNKKATATWSYNGQTPGTELRIKHGERARIQLQNALPQPTTIHWHGLRIDNAYDGVAGLTQDAVKPGESFDYEFDLPDSGTYWYHPHNKSWEQVARGLYGPLIIEEKDPIQVDRDVVLMVDDWLLNSNNQFDDRSFGAMGHWSHGGRTGNLPTINGQNPFQLKVRAGERLRLRVICAANSRIFNLKFGGHAPTIVAVDGQPTKPTTKGTNPINLAPGQRVDLIIDAQNDPNSSFDISDVHRGQDFAIGKINYTNEAPIRANPSDSSIILPMNPKLVSVDPNIAQLETLTMEGGAMGGLRGASIGGRTNAKNGKSPKDTGYLSINQLVQEKLIWSFNGVAGMPEKPFFDVKQGQPMLVRMTNDTSWDHVMHIHGHHGQIMERAYQLVEPEHWRDGFTIRRGETIAFGFIADNPGKWMFHCHMLEHQAGGMMTWFNVSA